MYGDVFIIDEKILIIVVQKSIFKKKLNHKSSFQDIDFLNLFKN